MRPGYWIAPLAGLAFAAGSAQASVHTLTYTITNNTSTPWQEVIFDIRPPVGSYDPAQYALVQFMVDVNNHESTKHPVDIIVVAPTNKSLRFDYSNYQPMTSADGPVTFTIMVDNPSGMAFRIGYRKVLVPAPAGVVAGLGAMAYAASRRRRVS